ncbi:hypothetical protein BDN72DRAFT_860939 [Pluteus cervinus]|uniref:Uncharacterized protein n=1 Tax=Pluteus cervinus TaxID=181527 RepID=A0ACD3AGZ7_9AGAR|nr:hypothetical protein BDN72DRAFT_860939 [Pluteus cervinus]
MVTAAPKANGRRRDEVSQIVSDLETFKPAVDENLLNNSDLTFHPPAVQFNVNVTKKAYDSTQLGIQTGKANLRLNNAPYYSRVLRTLASLSDDRMLGDSSYPRAVCNDDQSGKTKLKAVMDSQNASQVKSPDNDPVSSKGGVEYDSKSDWIHPDHKKEREVHNGWAQDMRKSNCLDSPWGPNKMP